MLMGQVLGYAEVRKALIEDLLDHFYTSKDPLPMRLAQA